MARKQKLKRRIKASTKLEIVDQLAQSSNRQLAKEYGVSRSNVMRWKQQEHELRKLSGDACRLPGGDTKIIGEELHEALTEKILYERSAQRRVTRCMINVWASEIRTNMNIDVTICPSWVDRFMARAGFVLRKGTRKPVLEDSDIIERGALFVNEVRDIIAQFSIPPTKVFNLDEMAVFFDHSKHTTVHSKGAKDVPVQSFGFEKQRVTAVFCASAAGEKKMPLVAPNTILLIFDSARCHTAKGVKEYLASRAILYTIIPGGMTGFSQPVDFGWFAQVKNQLSKSIDEWKRAGPHEFTRGGRVKPPAPAIVAAWLTDAWEIMQHSTIKVSFTRCALGSNEELHLARHERLGASFLQRLVGQGGEQHQANCLHDILDEFDDLIVVDDV